MTTTLTGTPARPLRTRPATPPVTPVPPPTAAPPGTAPQAWDRVRFSGSASLEHDEPLGEDDPPAPLIPAQPPLPDPRQWAGSLARAAVEVLVGMRPPTQLSRWLAADLYASLSRRAGLAVRILGRPRRHQVATIRRVRVCGIRAGVQEATVVVHDGVRVRGVALRLEEHRGRWQATALEIG